MNEKLTLSDCFKYPNASIQEFERNMRLKKCSDYENILDIIQFKIDIFGYFKEDMSNCKLILRNLSDLTDDESFKYQDLSDWYGEIYLDTIKSIDYLRSINIDIDGFIEAGKAVAK